MPQAIGANPASSIHTVSGGFRISQSHVTFMTLANASGAAKLSHITEILNGTYICNDGLESCAMCLEEELWLKYSKNKINYKTNV